MKAIFTLVFLSLCFGMPARLQGAEEIDTPYDPLEVGLTWTADVTGTGPTGQPVRGTATREITGIKEIGGKNYFVMKTSIEGIPGFGSFILYRRKQADGIYAIMELDPEKREFLEMPLPPTVGKTWEVPSVPGKLLFRLEALEDVTVGETKYEECLKASYRSDTAAFSSYYHAAPGIGNVMETMRIGEGKLVFTHKTLVKKEPGAPAKTDARK